MIRWRLVAATMLGHLGVEKLNSEAEIASYRLTWTHRARSRILLSRTAQGWWARFAVQYCGYRSQTHASVFTHYHSQLHVQHVAGPNYPTKPAGKSSLPRVHSFPLWALCFASSSGTPLFGLHLVFICPPPPPTRSSMLPSCTRGGLQHPRNTGPG